MSLYQLCINTIRITLVADTRTSRGARYIRTEEAIA
jgi:hypothetical protein